MTKTRFVIFLCAAAVATAAQADVTVELEQRLLGPRYFQIEFGYSVAIEGDVLVIGERKHSQRESQAGAVHVYKREGGAWTQQAKLESSERQRWEWFGHSVAISGATLVVGAPGSREGAVYVFTLRAGQWSQQAKLALDDGNVGDRFGDAVDLEGDTLVVGAPGRDTTAINDGAAYVYGRTGESWALQAVLLPPPLTQCGGFGDDVAVDGETVAVGSYNPVGLQFACSFRPNPVHVYDRQDDEWSQVATLLPDDLGRGLFFGTRLALDNDTLWIGYGKQFYEYVRDNDQWTRRASILSDPDDTNFGFAALEGDTAVAAAFRDEGDEWLGRPHVFQREEGAWTSRARILTDDREHSDAFGVAIGLSGDTVVIGAPRLGRWDSGAAYVFRIRCLLEFSLDIKPSSPVNPINPRSHGVIKVAILGHDELDVATIDPTTLRFGPGQATPIDHSGRLFDMNMDGYLDLVHHYRTEETGIECHDDSATFTGETFEGCVVEGTDSITTVGNCS